MNGRGHFVSAWKPSTLAFLVILVSMAFLIPSGFARSPVSDHGTRTGLEILISEVAPDGGGFEGDDWVELVVTSGSGDISGYVLSTFDSQTKDEAFANSSVAVSEGDRIIVHYNGTIPDESDATGDTNGNGFVDLYIASSDLSGTNEQVALYTGKNYTVALDAVCWSNGDMTESEAKDVQVLVDADMWPSSSASAMTVSSDVKEGVSIARKEGAGDTNTRDDWYLEPEASPGGKNRYFNFTGEVLITGAYLARSPKSFTFEVVSGDGDVSCLYFSDLDGIRSFIAKEPLTLSQGDVFELSYGGGTNETDAIGDINRNGIRELYTRDTSPTGTTDSAALFLGWEILDAVAWCTDGKLSPSEANDLHTLIAYGEWVGNTSEDCVNVSLMGTKNEIVRKTPYDDTDSKVDWKISGEIKEEINLNEFNLTTFSDIDSVTCGVSPDSSFRMMAGLIENATDSIHIEVYIFDNYKLAEKILAAQERGIEVKIFLEGAPIGIPDMQKYIMELITEKGGEVRYMITDNTEGVNDRFTNIHAKYMVVDNKITFITSENYRLDGIPYYGTKGNRGWSVIIESDDVAEYFEKVFSYDFTPESPDSFPFTEGHGTYGGPSADFDPSDKSFQPKEGKHEIVFKAETLTGDISVTPVLCPDHTSDLEAILPLLESAKDYIWVQQHSVSDMWDTGNKDIKNQYLESLYEAAKKGVEVRILLDETFMFDNKHWEIINDTNERALNENLNMIAKFTSNKEIEVKKVHNKGIIVDGKKVLVSSINWATNSIYNNREVGVIIESPDVANYYRDVFLLDWGSADIEAYDSIEGVIEGSDGDPIENANVTVDGMGIYVMTDENGRFFIDKIPVANYLLNITAKGYKSRHVNVEVRIGSTQNRTYGLEKVLDSKTDTDNKLSFTLVIILAVILVLITVILLAIILHAKKTRKEEKHRTITRISGDEHPFDDGAVREENDENPLF